MHFSLKIAIASLKTHKMRTVLAMLGVFLGALALTGVQHVSLAMVRKAEIETEKLGPNLFMARGGQIRVRRSGSVRFTGHSRNFKESDAQALMQGLPSALLGAPFITEDMSVRHKDIKIMSRVIATTPSHVPVRNFGLQAGRFLTEKDVERRAMVAVLGEKIATRLFGSVQNALGKEVFYYRARLEVVGVMEAKGTNIAGEDQDEQVFVPLTTFMRRMSNRNYISGVYIQLAKGADQDQAKNIASDILRRRHNIGPGQKDDFSVITAKDTIKLQRQALDLVSILGLISSSVSFGVGGLGILSIMILLVRARRLEIGVRRAVGARRNDIVSQFLFEAGLLSGVGGTLGVFVGLALVTVAYALGVFPYVYNPLLVVLILIGSVLLGLAAGAYPAWQASRFEILDILKAQE